MKYITRSHLVKSGVNDNIIRFEWDDWDLQKAYQPVDEKFEKRMMSITKRAVMAFAIGCLEWIVYRFDGLFDEELPEQYLEAAWAKIIDWRYVWSPEPDYDYWSGSILGPLALGIAIVIEAGVKIYEEGEDPAVEAAEIESLVRHVLNDVKPFKGWRGALVQRLERLYPRKSNDLVGPLVPPDVDKEFIEEGIEQRIRAYLKSLDIGANQFLRSPKDMFDEGFKGKPYTI